MTVVMAPAQERLLAAERRGSGGRRECVSTVNERKIYSMGECS